MVANPPVQLFGATVSVDSGGRVPVPATVSTGTFRTVLTVLLAKWCVIVMTKVPDFVPSAVGRKWTTIGQLAENGTPTLALQLKSPEPAGLIPVTVSVSW